MYTGLSTVGLCLFRSTVHIWHTQADLLLQILDVFLEHLHYFVVIVLWCWLRIGCPVVNIPIVCWSVNKFVIHGGLL